MICFVELECRIFEANSLKDKRSVLQKILTRTKQKYNVSAAETGHQDLWQLTQVSIVTIASSRQAAEREMNQVLKYMDSFPEWERIHTNYEWL